MDPEIPLFFGCLLLSAFFSGSETAFLAGNRLRLRVLAKEGDAPARRVLDLIEDPRRLLAGILVGNNVFNVLAASAATAYLVTRLGETKGVIAATAISTVLLVVFSEYLPKTIAAIHPIKMSRYLSQTLRGALVLLTPLVVPLEAITRPLGRLLGRSSDAVGLADLRLAVSEGVSSGTLDATVGRVLRGALTFQWKRVVDVLIPRVDVKGVRADASFATCLDAFRREGFSRLLVTEGDNPDSDLGYLALKDLALVPESDIRAWSAKDSVRDSMRVPESLPLVDLLARMRQGAVHFAVVKDEHGGTEGIVTLEDILEELVGEIRDEHDRAGELPAVEKADNHWLVRGDVSVKELQDRLDLEIRQEEATTVGGLVATELGRVAREGDVVDLAGFRLTVLSVRDRRVQRVKLERRGGQTTSS
jgi:putative hemolysin